MPGVGVRGLLDECIEEEDCRVGSHKNLIIGPKGGGEWVG